MIISKMRRTPLFVVAILVVGVLFLGVYKIAFENGLQSTLFFKAIGYWSYPVFFGAIIYVLYIFARLAINYDRYITADNGVIIVGGTQRISINSITNVTITRSIFGSNINITLDNGNFVKIKGIYLSNSPTVVASDIENLAGISIKSID